MTPIRLLIADDHAIVRTGLRALIESTSDMEVVAEASEGRTAIELAVREKPDVAILDLEMPNGGIVTASAVRERCERTRVLVLTMHDDPAFVRAALEAGSSGYVVKEALGTELLTAIRAVHQGRSYLNVANVHAAVSPAATGTERKDSPDVALSPREREVLLLLAYGHTNREIGEELHLSHRTIATYRARLSEKLDLNTRAEIVRYALHHGLLRRDDEPQ